ncbi:MAG: hypothetical protein HY738_02775 [Bacteroidia bacterium]|nr:hypothetical protein [Bacteroidia bacterium]
MRNIFPISICHSCSAISKIVAFAVFCMQFIIFTYAQDTTSTFRHAQCNATLSTSLKPPVIILTDACPKPLVFDIPVKVAKQYTFQTDKGLRTITLEPPKIIMLPIVFTPFASGGAGGGLSPLPSGGAGGGLDQSAAGIGLFTTYTTNDRLALDAITCGYRDNAGNLWFGTRGGGVSRYDGCSFTNFTTSQGLANNVVWCITEDKNGNFWFGTDGGGISCYNGIFFTNYTTAQGLANNVIKFIIEDKNGNLWFGTYGGGVDCYAPISSSLDKSGQRAVFTNFTTSQGLANNYVLCIAEDKAGNLWFGTLGGGVSRYTPLSPSVDKGVQSGVFTNFTTSQGLANNIVYSIIEDKVGNLWFGTAGGGVSRYNSDEKGTDEKLFTNFTTAHGLADNTILNIAEDKAGNLWFGTAGGGVSRYTPLLSTFIKGENSGGVTNFTTSQGLANNIVYSIIEDKTGNIWFGTDGGGVSRFDGGSFINFTISLGFPNKFVKCIIEDNTGNIWFGTYGSGAICYNGKSFTNYTTSQGLANYIVHSIMEDKAGNLWFGTRGGGVSRYTPLSSLINGENRAVFTNFTTSQGLVNNVVVCITEDKTGKIWFGTNGGGVSCYGPDENGAGGNCETRTNINKNKQSMSKSFTSFTTAQGLVNNFVYCITEDRTGNLWFGTAGGISILLQRKIFINLTTTDGLPDDFVTQIVEDKQGKIIIGTNAGICELIPNTCKNIFSSNGPRWTVGQIYNSSTGYPVKDVNVGQKAMYFDSKGILWAATGSDKTAVVRIDYDAILKNDTPPAIVLKSVKVNNENVCWHDLLIHDRFLKPVMYDNGGDKKPDRSQRPVRFKTDSLAIILEESLTFGRTLSDTERDTMLDKFEGIRFDGITKFYPLPENLVLPYKHNSLTFEFTAIEPARPYLVKYQYILEGYDNDWSPVTNKTSASFGNIWEGTYTFV